MSHFGSVYVYVCYIALFNFLLKPSLPTKLCCTFVHIEDCVISTFVRAYIFAYNYIVLCYRMTKIDVRNYFEKIYGVNVASVHTRIQKGKVRRDRKQPAKFVQKSRDTKVAYLTLVIMP